MGGNPWLPSDWTLNTHGNMAYQIEEVDLQVLPPSTQLLSKREEQFYETLRVAKRKSEFLGGRLALKRLLAVQEQIENLQDIEILPQPSGKPQVVVKEKIFSGAFSITHSHGFAVAAVSRDAVLLGIDLEKIEHRIEAWKTGFFHPDELTGAGDEFLTALWTQKEAVVKLLGTGLMLNSFDVRCVNGDVQFYGRAREIYEELGAPAIQLETSSLLPGFMFSVAISTRETRFSTHII